MISENPSFDEALNPNAPCNPALLIGRNKQVNSFEAIAKRLAQGKENCKLIIVSGPKGIGKSSLMKKMESIAPSYQCKSLFFQVGAENSVSLFNEILPGIYGSIESIKSEISTNLLGRPPFAYEIPPGKENRANIGIDDLIVELQKAFVELSKALEKAKSIRSVIIFIDQVERLFLNDTDSKKNLHRLILSSFYHSKIMFCVSMDNEFLDCFLNNQPHQINRFNWLEFELRQLNKTETESIARNKLSLGCINIDDPVLSKLIDYTGGIPWEVVYDLRLLVEKAGDRKTINSQIFDETSGEFEVEFAKTLSLLSNEEKKVLYKLSTLNDGTLQKLSNELALSLEETERIVQKLEYGPSKKQIIIKRNDKIWFVSKAFQDYVFRTTRIEEEKGRILPMIGIIGKLLEESPEVPSDLEKMLTYVFNLFPNEIGLLKYSIWELCTKLITNSKIENRIRKVESIYLSIFNLLTKRSKFEEATIWTSEAVAFCTQKNTIQFFGKTALLILEKQIDEIYSPRGEQSNINLSYRKGLEIAKNINDYAMAGEFSLSLAIIQGDLSEQEKMELLSDAKNYLRRASNTENNPLANSHTARICGQIEKILPNVDSKELEKPIDSARLLKRNVKKIISITGFRFSGVYYLTPSLVFSSITQSEIGDTALLVDLGMWHELESNLNVYPFQNLEDDYSLIGLLKDKRRGSVTFDREKFRYDTLLETGVFKVGPELGSNYVQKVKNLANKGKKVYLLPLATRANSSDISNFSNDEVLEMITFLIEQIKPDLLFVTRPGLEMEGIWFTELNPTSLFHSILDVSDEIFVISRGDVQKDFNDHLKVMETIVKKPIWRLNAHLCINSSVRSLEIPNNVKDYVIFRLELQPRRSSTWQRIERARGIPFVELELEKDQNIDKQLSAAMKTIWSKLEKNNVQR